MKIAIVAVSVPALRQVRAFQEKYKENYPDTPVDIESFYIAGPEQAYLAQPELLIGKLAEADIAIADTMGASERMQAIVREGLERCRGQRIVIGNTLREYLRLGSFSMGMMSGKKKKESTAESDKKDGSDGAGQKEEKPAKSTLDKMHRMRRMAMMLGNVLPFGMTKDMKNIFLLIDYWQQATEEDIASFMHLLLRQYGGMRFLPKEKACTIHYGIYLKDPKSLKCEDHLDRYWKRHTFDPQKDTVALLFYGHSYPNDFLPVVRAMAETLKEGYNVLPIAFSQHEDNDLETLKGYLCQKEYPVCAVVNLMPFRLGAGPMGGDAQRAVDILKELDVPYLKPFCLTKVSEQEWSRADAVNPGEFLISIMLPEMDGGILTFPVGVMSDAKQLPELVPIEERLTTLANRINGLVRLQKLENEQKKLAVICYNYPPGENNLFGGAFLDTFVSVERLLRELKKAGYQTEELSAQKIQQYFVEEGHCNHPQWCDSKVEEITWKVDGIEYPIRGICTGNIFIGLQPVRENADMTQESYHDRNRKPSGEYRAFYEWLRDGFQADAMLHFGTHGTLEFLPGRDNGMMENCWPDQLVGKVPHFYYYYIGNPSEAMIAKRRTHATLISYQGPQLKKSGLYGACLELKEMIAEYRESMQSAPERCDDLLKNISEKAEEAGFAPEQNLDELEEQLYVYENSLITDGLHILNEEETGGILHALEGKYLSASTAGDVIKNPEILPSGRNLIQFDPRLVPTKTAYERGTEAARQSLEAYVREHGTYPESTAVILWGLETSRSQGETVGQIMYYLGLRLKKEGASYDDRLEIIPTEELVRPRIDVMIHICGFFRDMYPNLVDNLNEMMQQLLMLDETPEQNQYAAHTRQLKEQLLMRAQETGTDMDEEEALELASSRIFGPKEGEYGTRLTDVVRKGNWKEASELGASFVEDLSYAYTCHRRGCAAKELVRKQYENVSLISQVRNNVEYELTDLDHYYEFYGGLAKAVENERGEKPDMLVADTTGETVNVQDLKTAVNRGIIIRLLNPAWIEGMLRHEYHGVQQIEKRFENIMGFAASTDSVDSSTFSALTRRYAQDEQLRHRMQESNKWAYMKMMERLMEAANRGYYEPDEEELSAIQEAYLETEQGAEQ